MIHFVAVLDYDHLDNGMFLTSFARSLARKTKRGIILHRDSAYTERIIQTGVMRDAAVLRCIKELNHRLVALFADEGISTIAVNGHQKSLVSTGGDSIQVNGKELLRLPEQPMILLSALGWNRSSGEPEPVPLPDLAAEITGQFGIPEVTLFSVKEASEMIREELPGTTRLKHHSRAFVEEHIPPSFHEYSGPVKVTTPLHF